MTERLSVGVIGVGSMGRNHTRVYQELPSADLVGVTDVDGQRAHEVANAFDTRARGMDSLLNDVDAVSIAVPTQYHYEIAREAIEAGVHVLVEKPFVDRLEHGRILTERAKDLGVTLQVGHIERFNPAIRTLADIVPDLDIIAFDAKRLGPPVDREIDVNPVLDLMIHDIDVVRSVVDGDVAGVSATHSNGDPYVTATLEFENNVVGTLTASRITQQKIRHLSITAREGQVTVDYINQSIEIHRQSLPEYIEQNGDVRFRHQNIVEHPTVENGEPLKTELDSFIKASTTATEPVVTGEDGLAAIRIANRITDIATIDEDRAMAKVKP